MTTFVFASGETREIADFYEPERVVGLDPEGRILVNDGGDFLFGLTLCCNASDKGTESGIACRGCYGTEETGAYYFEAHYADVADVVADPLKEIR